ncbi:GerAB/ArcD/ProY family transporter [Gorillibacterium timonense]|uniref:GerAB/ArcD/ProY family transporter n=1 Tax=Gorillibacterium timonense TaxID=1689269 RepID=UPI00071C74BB|nr:GerAB/ArcD/ProY family transporter [Gorillibacterium timonense]
MTNETISPKQLFALMILFELGTALVVPIGLESGHAIWLSILLALPGGLLLFLIFSDLHRRHPGASFSSCMQKIMGKWIGFALSLLYISFFLLNGSRNLRESGNLLLSAYYDQTPILFMNAIMVIAIVYFMRKGVNVFGRTSEIYLFVIAMIGIICNFVVIASGLVKLHNLFPLHMQDWKGALSSAYPDIWLFPFGETLLFSILLPYLSKSKSARKTGLLAMLTSGLLLSFTHAIEISVLGEDIYGRTTFPLFTTISLVNVANFIQRLDAFVMLAMIICVFFKATAYCFGACILAADLFHVQDFRMLAVPIGVVLLFTSLISAENYVIHLDEGKVAMAYILPVTNVLIPAILAVVDRVRTKFGLYR